ncbi:MAG: cadmium resistance transporter [Rhizonema sp. PD37]|nr:cadmium resistance transporter [Rhizonema sp. PD37]
MNWLITAISTGAVAFSATNIDDIVILLLFFSQVNASFTSRDIVTGQYIGFAVLIITSLPGLFGGLIIPQHWIGLLGMLPIAIGISSLVNQEEDLSELVKEETEQFEDSTIASFLSPQTYSVAVVTVANGSDNISVYVPLFASSDLGSFLIIIVVFFLLIGVWCYTAYKLSHQKVIADLLTCYGNQLVPVVLIGLGAFIVLKSGALNIVKLVASCVCLIVIVRNNERADEIEEN